MTGMDASIERNCMLPEWQTNSAMSAMLKWSTILAVCKSAGNRWIASEAA